VSSFDYGFAGDTSPQSFAGEMLYSPRSPVESNPQAEPFVGTSSQEADLAITQRVDNANAGIGGYVTLPVTIQDRGPRAASDVVTDHPAPAGLPSHLDHGPATRRPVGDLPWGTQPLPPSNQPPTPTPTTTGGQALGPASSTQRTTSRRTPSMPSAGVSTFTQLMFSAPNPLARTRSRRRSPGTRSKWTTGAAQDRVGLRPAAQEHMLAQEKGKDRFLLAVRELSQAFTPAVPHEDRMPIRDDLAFFPAGQPVNGGLPPR